MKNSKETLYIVMPAYNEEETITDVVKNWYPVLSLAGKDSKLVISDNNSKDNTYKILKKLQKKYPQLDVIKNNIKGHGPTVICLYKYAIKNKTDYIFQTDSDGQTNPKEFSDFWKLRKKYDAILGQRNSRGDGKSRKIVENVLCRLLRFIFGVKMKDSNAPFRLMKTELVSKYINRFDETYNLPNVMLSTFFTFYHENIAFREISFKPRQGGKNSINLKKIFKIGFDSLKDFYIFKENMTNKKNFFSLITKYKSFILYGIFGILTTIVNVISYYVFAHLLSLSTTLSTIISWILAIIFAYVTNRKYVFESKSSKIVKEFISFILCRLATGLLDLGIMYYFVDILHYNDIFIKIISNIIVIILNYIASKLFIFNKRSNIQVENERKNFKKKINDVLKNNKDKIFKIVFIIFSIRVFFLILVPPFIGIANNGDFQRLSQSAGIEYRNNPWSEDNYFDSFYNYITNDYKIISPIDNGWSQIFVIFPKMAKLLSHSFINGLFDIRYLGFVNAIFYLLAVYLVLCLIKRIKSNWSYIYFLLFLLIMGDSYILQYFNSFYSEIGSVTFYLILLALLIYGFENIYQKSKLKKFLSIIFITISSLFAILSKQQDILIIIPIFYVLYLLLRKYRINIFARIAYLCSFVILIGLLFVSNKAAGNITTYNVTMMDLLSYSSNSTMHFKNMGLGSEDIEILQGEIGKNAFTTNIDWKIYEDKFTRQNELKILLKEPKIFLKMILKRSKKLFSDDLRLANYQKSDGAVPCQKTTENKLWSNIKKTIFIKSFFFYAVVLFIALLISIFGNKIKYLKIIPNDLFNIYLILPLSSILRFVTILVGDSSHDDIKHFFSLNVEFDFIFIINAICIVYIIYKYFHNKKEVINEKV